ncbi:MAG: bacillithiol biosynthesis BshC, partial [Rhodothermales bacterium]
MTSEVARDPVTRLQFGDLKRFSDIYRAYCNDYPSLSEYFAGDFRQTEALEQAIDRTTSFKRDRQTLVSVLKRQNERWGARESTLHNISRLLDPSAVAVVTGQQVGLLTGPLYTALKTITALQVARELEAKTGKPCIPVFWLEGEDHDVAEATSV